METTKAPIIFFVYNRADHAKETIQGILTNPEAKDTVLYIFADGPKPNASEGDKKKIQQVRDYIHTVTGFKDIIIEEAEKNKGLAPSTIYGVSKVLEKHDRMIMIEDDDVPTPYFLAYMNECLEKYKDDKQIWGVSGYLYLKDYPLGENNDDVFLTSRTSSWGWGTWKRCWDKVIWDVEVLKRFFTHKSIEKGFNDYCGIDHSAMMKSLFRGRNSSWAVRFNFATYIYGGLDVRPRTSLINNIGLDGSGTHSGGANTTRQIRLKKSAVKIPDHPSFDKIYNTKILKMARPNNYLVYLLYKLGWYELPRKIVKIKRILFKHG